MTWLITKFVINSFRFYKKVLKKFSSVQIMTCCMLVCVCWTTNTNTLVRHTVKLQVSMYLYLCVLTFPFIYRYYTTSNENM